jgi:DNA-binding response OmpR family regulator
MDGQKLLIVEDCEPVAQLLAASLCARFVEIAFAPTLAAARRKVRLADMPTFDFVICSLTLPDGLGLEFKQWLDDYDASRRLPFVLIAGTLPGLRHTQTDIVMLPKPFQVSELLRALDEARHRVVRCASRRLPLPSSAPPPAAG